LCLVVPGALIFGIVYGAVYGCSAAAARRAVHCGTAGATTVRCTEVLSINELGLVSSGTATWDSAGGGGSNAGCPTSGAPRPSAQATPGKKLANRTKLAERQSVANSVNDFKASAVLFSTVASTTRICGHSTSCRLKPVSISGYSAGGPWGPGRSLIRVQLTLLLSAGPLQTSLRHCSSISSVLRMRSGPEVGHVTPETREVTSEMAPGRSPGVIDRRGDC